MLHYIGNSTLKPGEEKWTECKDRFGNLVFNYEYRYDENNIFTIESSADKNNILRLKGIWLERIKNKKIL